MVPYGPKGTPHALPHSNLMQNKIWLSAGRREVLIGLREAEGRTREKMIV